MAHANEEMLARFYAAYAGRDAEAIAGQLTDDAFVLIPGRGPLGGVYRGRKPGTTKARPGRAAQLRDRGLTQDEIATALGVSRTTVCRYLAATRE